MDKIWQILENIAQYLNISSQLCILIIGFGIFLVLCIVFILLKIAGMNHKYKKFMSGKNAVSLEDVFMEQREQILSLEELVKEQNQKIELVNNIMGKTYSKMGFKKYDALDNMAGKISFVLVLLNAANDGFLMNCIHTRESSFVYFRDIKNGNCDVKLGKEEEEAITMAVNKW